MKEDEMVRWHHRLDGHEFEQAPGDDEGQGNLVYCSFNFSISPSNEYSGLISFRV